MNKLNVLFLGWDFLPSHQEETETNCFSLVKALANKAALSLIIPKANPEIILTNVDVNGLNQIDFSAIQARQPKPLPFAEASYIRMDIPLYGASDTVETQRTYSKEKTRQELPSVESGIAAESYAAELVNIFNQAEWETLNLEAKIIQYARYATRLAANRSFDIIFADNWLTYLAGSELKLVTDKPLAIQVNSLSVDRSDHNSQGWVYELEKLVLQRADYIFTSNPNLAASVEAVYEIAPNNVISLAAKNNTTIPEVNNSPGQSTLNVAMPTPDNEPGTNLTKVASMDGVNLDTTELTADRIMAVLLDSNQGW